MKDASRAQKNGAQCQAQIEPSADVAKPLGMYIRFKAFRNLLEVSDSTLNAMMDPDSAQFDRSMPPAYQITARTKLWKTADVLAWIESRVVLNGKQPVASFNKEVGNV